MMYKFIVFFTFLVFLSTRGYAQNEKILSLPFSVSIDSVMLTGDNMKNKVLSFYITIKNHSSQNLKFSHTPISMVGLEENNDWNMILKKDNEIQVEWDDSRYMGDYHSSVKLFVVEKNKEFHLQFPIQLSSMLVSNSQDDLSGRYTAQLILSTAKTEGNPRLSTNSNIIDFSIE